MDTTSENVGTAEEIKYTAFDLNTEIFQMLSDEPFWASFSREVDKTPSTAIPTAAIRINPHTIQYEMLYNPQWFASLSWKERVDIVKHEYFHAILQHLDGSRFPKTDDADEHKLRNIAMDLAINSHLSNLPMGACIPGMKPFEKYKTGLTAEIYLQQLRDETEQFKDMLSNMEGMDVHDFFNDDSIPESVKQLAAQRLKESMKRAAREANQKNWGSVPQSIKEEIISFIEGKLDWRGLLRYFIKTSRRADRHHTIRKINRRFPMIHPGAKVQRTANIAIAIDQSGSVSNEMLEMFYGELNKLSQYATFTMIPFDTEVEEDHIHEWKKGKREVAKRYRSGGTCFTAPTKWCNQHGGFDGLIIMTDMAAEKPIPSKCKRMWITDADGKRSQYFSTDELVVAIE